MRIAVGNFKKCYTMSRSHTQGHIVWYNFRSKWRLDCGENWNQIKDVDLYHGGRRIKWHDKKCHVRRWFWQWHSEYFGEGRYRREEKQLDNGGLTNPGHSGNPMSYAGDIRKKDQQALMTNSWCIFYLSPACTQRKNTLMGIDWWRWDTKEKWMRHL